MKLKKVKKQCNSEKEYIKEMKCWMEDEEAEVERKQEYKKETTKNLCDGMVFRIEVFMNVVV